MSLYNHLCPQKNIRLFFRKCLPNLFILSFFTGTVPIHPENSGLWKYTMTDAFQFFRSASKGCEIFTFTIRTNLRKICLITAVMTLQNSVFMQIQAHITVWATKCFSAFSATHKGRIPSSIHKEHHLLSSVQPFLNFPFQHPRKNRAISLFQLLSHIHHLHLR